MPNPLLSTPDEEQQHLLDVISEGYRDTWPIAQYVEATLYQEYGIRDTRSLILRCPRVPIAGNQSSYGWFRFEGGRPDTYQPKDTIGLTIAGMVHLSRPSKTVGLFLDVLAVLVEAEGFFTPSPTTLQTVEIASTELLSAVNSRRGRSVPFSSSTLDRIKPVLAGEPSTWHCTIRSLDTSGWVVSLSPFIRSYADISDPQDYLERLVSEISSPPEAPAPRYASALSLPEAIDYLNAVWRLFADKPLLRIARAEAAAKLALECATADEFDSRLSALCSILDDLRLPDSDSGKKLSDLKDYLATKLSDEPAARSEACIDDLRDLFALRAWRQHPGAVPRGRGAVRRLGIELPTDDWGAAWRVLQARTVSALAGLREEIEQLADE